MRKITKFTVGCFLSGQPCTLDNSSVKVRRYHDRLLTDGTYQISVYYLWGHEIGRYERKCVHDKLIINDAGWQTATTKDRLNGILEVAGVRYRVYQKDWAWYLWDWENKTSLSFGSMAVFVRDGKDWVLEVVR